MGAARERRLVLPVGASPRHRCAIRSEIAQRQPREARGRLGAPDLLPFCQGGRRAAGGCSVAGGKCRPGEIGMGGGFGLRGPAGREAISPGLGKRGTTAAVVRRPRRRGARFPHFPPARLGRSCSGRACLGRWRRGCRSMAQAGAGRRRAEGASVGVAAGAGRGSGLWSGTAARGPSGRERCGARAGRRGGSRVLPLDATGATRGGQG